MSQAGAFRSAHGARIDRSQVLPFHLDGEPLTACAGDTVASALLAHGRHLVARSFKYHRPRGILTAGVEEPNALLTLGQGDRTEPNIAATVTEVHAGLVARTQNAWPSVGFDLMAINNLLSGLFVAGFYYKTFMPSLKGWMFFETFIRKAAGLGRASQLPDPDRYDWHHGFVDVLVVGAGPAGLAAALGAARAGLAVTLVEQDFEPGGSLLAHAVDSAHAQWLRSQLDELRANPNVCLLTRATALGLFDGNTVGVLERGAPGLADAARGVPRQRLHLLRACSIILACGALERPLLFAGNDRPGVMLSGAVGSYVNRYGVLPGRRALFCTNNDAAYGDAISLARAGASVTLADLRAQAGSASLLQAAHTAGVDVLLGTAVVQAKGARRVKQCTLVPYDLASARCGNGPISREVDLLAMSGGWTPTLHLSSHRGIRPVYQDALCSFVPGGFDKTHFGAGSMLGTQTLAAAIRSGWDAAIQAAAVCGKTLQAAPPPAPDAPDVCLAFQSVGHLRTAGTRGPAFVDFQNDVTTGDVELARREGFESVEHLKRYTTQGMGTDQGKTSNFNALALMASSRAMPLAAVGTTTFRPPYTPATIGALAGRHVRAHLAPVRRSALHDWHAAHGARWVEAGYWMRPLWYAGHGATLSEAYRAEMEIVRGQVGMADVSTLGKIDVQGPDAAEFLNRVYVNGFASLAVGRARYGLMLREDGIVLDDGTTSRIGETEFFMTTTTAQAARVLSHLEFLLQVVWPQLRVTVASVSDQWAAMSVAGPQARAVLSAAFPSIRFDPEAFAFMGVVDATLPDPLTGVAVRIIRLTFSGELAYEVYTPSHHGRAVWEHLMARGQPWNLRPYGLEALASLRIEKGHVVGSEMDGRTTLDDLGAAAMASSTKPFWGDALRHSDHLRSPGRPSLVGLEALDPHEPPNNGAILFFADDEIKGHGRGHITSTTDSQQVGKSIALGLLQGGRQRIGQTVIAASPVHGRQYLLKVVDPCFLDPQGARYRD